MSVESISAKAILDLQECLVRRTVLESQLKEAWTTAKKFSDLVNVLQEEIKVLHAAARLSIEALERYTALERDKYNRDLEVQK